MKLIVTLTLNPSVDVQFEADDLVPVQKMRCEAPLQFPGGGGINVSRVIRALGGHSITVQTAGWLTGQFLEDMIEHHGLLTRTIPISGRTRMSATIFESSSGQEYRLTPPGPQLTEEEWQACIDAPFEYKPEYVVATGSLPEGVPADFYGQIAQRAKERGAKVILDTSGHPLFEALKVGVHLVKPNQHELEVLAGRKAETAEDQEALCRELVDRGQAEIVALTLGGDGALLVSKDETLRMPTPKVQVKSTVGAGDSFVGGLTLGLAEDMGLEGAFALGIACGTASVMNAGTDLSRLEDVQRIYKDLTGTALDDLSE